MSSLETTASLHPRRAARLKQGCERMLEIDDAVKKAREQVKLLMQARRQQEAKLLKMYQRYGLGTMPVEIADGEGGVRAALRYSVSKRKNPLKASTINDALIDVLGDDQRVDEIVAKIDSRRGYRKVAYIKRTKGKKA